MTEMHSLCFAVETADCLDIVRVGVADGHMLNLMPERNETADSDSSLPGRSGTGLGWRVQGKASLRSAGAAYGRSGDRRPGGRADLSRMDWGLGRAGQCSYPGPGHRLSSIAKLQGR